MNQPNFVLFITDQHRADWLGCYGHPVVRTPNIDSIASNGISFERFYVASPVCMPNRASLMTGRMPSVHGVRANGIPLSLDAVTFVDVLRESGYATTLVGKSHLQPFGGAKAMTTLSAVKPGYRQVSDELKEAVRQGLRRSGYDQESPGFWAKPSPRLSLPYYGFGQVELVTGHGDGVGGDYRSWLLEREPKAMDLIGAPNQFPHGYTCPQAIRTRLPTELYPTTYIAERASAFIEAHVRDAGHQPFFLMVSFPDPHHPFNPPGKYWDMYQPEQFDVPEAFRRNTWAPPPHVSAVHAEREQGKARLTGFASFATTPREAQEAAALTAGMITLVDDAIGNVLASLEKAGLADKTVRIFTSDHGEHLGDHRLLLKGSEQYSQLLRVPFIWSEPPTVEVRTRSGAIGSTIDISATILDRAEIMPYLGIQGQSLQPVIAGDESKGRTAAYVQYEHQRPSQALGGVPRVHTLVDERWRVSVYDGVPWGELYNLEADPGEFDNLWDDVAHREIKANLLERLLRMEIAHVDRAPLPTALA